jgi:glycogen(starch) synthase
MKIAIVASDYIPTVGGVQTAVRNIARNLQRMGHSVIILSSLPPANVPARDKVDGVWVNRFPWGRRPLWSLPIRALGTLVGMARALHAFQPDLVYVHFLSINALYVLLLHYLMRFRLVTSARGNDIQGIPLRSDLPRWMLTRLFARADAAIFCSSFVRHDAAPYLGRVSPRAYVGVVGDGFDPDEFLEPNLTKVADLHKAQPYILAMGRLVHKKGFDLLIRAFAHLASEFPQVQLLIAGDGEERAALERLIDELNLRERVILLGFTDRATSLALFWGCEFFVLSSRLEPFGIVVAEAMAAHKAVLATRSGGVVDLVQPGTNGLLVDADVGALAQGMRELLAHPDATRALGKRAAQTIQTRTWAAVTEQYVRVFQQVTR